MKILIAGAGEVGTHLAKLLDQENHYIRLMDSDNERLKALRDYPDILTYLGQCTSLKDLTEAEVADTDLFIAVTPTESENITACMLAAKLGAAKTLARIDNHEYLQPQHSLFFEQLGVHSMIYPEIMASQEIVSAIKAPWTRMWWELADGKIILTAVKVGSHAPIADKQLKEFSPINKKFHIAAIKRKNETFIPNGNDKILPNDLVYFTVLKEEIEELPQLLGKTAFEAKDVMIMGGSEIALQTVKQLPSDIKVKLLEIDRKIAEKLAEETPSNVTVFWGDGRDTELLLSEGVDRMDIFMALTDNSETNMLSCIMAKQHGAKKTIAEIENIDYLDMAEQFNINTVINKKMIAASKIYELMLRADVSNIKSLAFFETNVGEVVAQPKSKITRKKIKNLRLPTGITLGALTRDGKSVLIGGETQIEANDQVIVFFKDKVLKDIERLFN